jgi:dihydrolipoamide dehydrogenase
MQEFDVAVVGGGPGGYVCAIRCAQLGLKTALVEKYGTLGGTCLNVGCIPSKALLDSSERYFDAVKHFQNHGIVIKDVGLDFKKMVSRVRDVVKDTTVGIDYLMKKNKVTILRGLGTFKDPHTMDVRGDKDSLEFKAKKFVIATGSKPASLKGVEIDKERILTSTEALYLKEVPKHLLVIGGGVIGLELGSVYARLGSKVSVVEYLPSIIPTMDAELGKNLQKTLKKEGMEFYLSHAVSSVERKEKEIILKATDQKKKKEVELKGDYCLLSVGRSPYTKGLGLESAGISLGERGMIPINEHCQTQVSHIYAIGDVVRGAMLAHKAEEEGVYVAEHIVGQKPHINYNLIPGVVYTWPEVASVGQTEKDLKDKKIPFKKGSFPFKASGRARASNESDGFIKVLSHKETDEILGVHMIGPRCADMIAEAVLAMEYRASAEDVARTCHAHPTYTEVFKEACLAATGDRAIHI